MGKWVTCPLNLFALLDTSNMSQGLANLTLQRDTVLPNAFIGKEKYRSGQQKACVLLNNFLYILKVEFLHCRGIKTKLRYAVSVTF